MLVLGALGAAVGFVACFHDRSFKDGEIRCSTDPSRLCPSGTYCIDGYCMHADLAGKDASDAFDLWPIVAVDGGQSD